MRKQEYFQAVGTYRILVSTLTIDFYKSYLKLAFQEFFS